MGEPFIGEIRAFGFNYPPSGWALCNGQILDIAQHQVLFSLLGTTYGGDGRTTFALPNLQGRTPISPSLRANYLSSHTHVLDASTAPANGNSPPGASPGVIAEPNEAYSPNLAGNLSAGTVAATGRSSGHPNIQPCLVINFYIALEGIYPSPK